MRWAPLLIGAFGAVAFAMSIQPKGESSLLIIGGDTDGYLSPCGCTKPMSGGIRRRMALAKQLASGGRATIIETGGLVKGSGPQDLLKAEAIAEALAKAGVDAVQIGYAESRLGLGGAVSLINLLGNAALCSTASESNRLGLQTVVTDGPFAIAGVDSRNVALGTNLGEPMRSTLGAIENLVVVSKEADLAPVLMYQGSLQQAKALPRLSELKLVLYRSTGAPDASPTRVGETLLWSPGEKGKFVLVARFEGGAFRSFQAYPLPPDVADDHQTSRIYTSYLGRVTVSGLLDKMPRAATAKFAGNEKCGSCHAKAWATWKDSAHKTALITLEKDKHDRDPDCVGCHVVGLNSSFGFKSRKSTPQLTGVGCESCHGPGASHAALPKKVKMMKVGAKSCVKCHVPDHSPGFDFKSYWQKIKH